MRGGSVCAAGLLCVLFFCAGGVCAAAQLLVRVVAPVTYVTPGTLYFRAGTSAGIAQGDTLTVIRGPKSLGKVSVTAVSSGSSVATIIFRTDTIRVGDSVWTRKPKPETPKSVSVGGTSGRGTMIGGSRISGRLALQYVGSGSSVPFMDLARPALVYRLRASRLGGTDLEFSIDGRTYSDLYPNHGPDFHKAATRMYELSLSNDAAGRWYGFYLGRFLPGFASGIGPVDGAQLFVRRGRFTFGILGGTQPDYVNSGVDMTLQKFAGYVSMNWGPDVFSKSYVTLAYGQQLNKGKPDRDFLYLESFVRPGGGFYFNANTEFDLHVREDGERIKKLRLTNSFLSMTWTPSVNWISISAGYDAARAIYLFESMKVFPDSLLDRSLREGFRGSVSISLPARLTLQSSGSFRMRTTTTPPARTLSGGLRVSNILNTGLSSSGTLTDIRGLYTEGRQMTFDLDAWFGWGPGATLRYDRYDYTLQGSGDKHSATTIGCTLNHRIFDVFYAMLAYDRIWEAGEKTWRLYSELGIHF
jgi:hypothetical protein